MTKKRGSTKKSLINLAAFEAGAGFNYGYVEAGELGPDMRARVRGMSVADKQILGGLIGGPGAANHSAVAIIAALATVDEDGDLVFGETRARAIEYVESLPDLYAPLITRLSTKIIDLTKVAASENGAMSEAKKN